jgi:hypothetical protein
MVSKGERKRQNRAERAILLEDFRLALLQHSNEQIRDIIAGWMNPLVHEDQELGDFIEDTLDNICESLGFRVATCTTEPQLYASYSAWRDSENEEQECVAEFVHNDLVSLRERIETLTAKELDELTEVAFQALNTKARDDGDASPPLYPMFIEYVISLITK